MIRLHFQNFNCLPISISGFRPDNVISLKHIWLKTNAYVTSLVETQINPSLLPIKDSLQVAIFQHHEAKSTLSNTANKLIGRRKQVEVMNVAKEEIAKTQHQ